jgi:hypothetical protein
MPSPEARNQAARGRRCVLVCDGGGPSPFREPGASLREGTIRIRPAVAATQVVGSRQTWRRAGPQFLGTVTQPLRVRRMALTLRVRDWPLAAHPGTSRPIPPTRDGLHSHLLDIDDPSHHPSGTPDGVLSTSPGLAAGGLPWESSPVAPYPGRVKSSPVWKLCEAPLFKNPRLP